MITRLDATNYRCFERLGVQLDDFSIIAGANGSGKTTLLDIPVLLGDLLRSRNVAAAFMDRQLGRGARAASLKEIPFPRGPRRRAALGARHHQTRSVGRRDRRPRRSPSPPRRVEGGDLGSLFATGVFE